MQLKLHNFGCFIDHDLTFDTGTVIAAPNGGGKTTLINAYVFALSGKTLNGFKPRKVDAPDGDDTWVVLTFGGLEYRRVLSAQGGTTFYVNGNVMTQSSFDKAFNVELAVACANVNMLTNPDLTSEQLRKLLAITGASDSDRAIELRKERKRLNALRKDAERYALTNVVVPTRTVEKPTESDLYLKEQFEYNSHEMLKQVTKVCPMCGAPRSETDIRHAQNARDNAKTFCDLHQAEYARILEKKHAYEVEDEEIRRAQDLVDTATKARRDVISFEQQINAIEEELRVEDERLLSVKLPEHVEVVTEQTFKSGRSQPTCTLTYKGVPLKSVNRAQRIKICIELLQYAKEVQELRFLPILVDNAESVQGLDDYKDVIPFIVA